jgi:LmbE family N-acetylglucosaminyl deacetylase/glycosyltransferase involved in cell wall biosynthesis
MNESTLVPYQASALPVARSVLVLAPHPDDEVFGPGGLLALFALNGTPVATAVLTDGAFGLQGETRQAHIQLREAESCRAAEVLGIARPDFWRIPDRELVYGETLVARLISAIQVADADFVLAPSLAEMHPDHRGLAMAAVEAVRRLDGKASLALYEVGVAMPAPSMLIDITPVLSRKAAAMACFTSQLAVQRYDEHIKALNRFRTYTLGGEVSAAEAFHFWNPAVDRLACRELFESEYQRQHRLGIPMLGGDDIPLVSILIRSVDRDSLSRTLDSVALQTYPNIEVLVIDALGAGHRALPALCGRFPLRFIAGESPRPRSLAANVGLENAQGKYILFLDDDDIVHPDHIEKLARHLEQGTRSLAAYTGISAVDRAGKEIHSFALPAPGARLLISNYIPIHAVLFSRLLVSQHGCRFDPAFDTYEDWDFWLQVGQYTDFDFIPGTSALYVVDTNSEHPVHEPAEIRRCAERIYSKWLVLTKSDRMHLLREYIQKIENSAICYQGEILNAASELDQCRNEISHLEKVLSNMQQEITQRNLELSAFTAQAEDLRNELGATYRSSSWRITAPLRYLKHALLRIRRF